ncbi:MAG: hypothetical protein HND58_09915 [Planctomycetota bacterium]|nr:MAG: hypothetical protein HND58_09915 [Planctomycetota bacterium]
MLDGGEFVVVEALGPRDGRALVHRLAVLAVELGRPHDPLVGAQTLGPEPRVLGPQLLVGRERVDHPRALALPLWVLVAVEEPVGQVVGADHGQRHEPGDLLPRPGEPEDGPGEDALAVGAL